MFTFFKNIIRAQRTATALAAVTADLKALERKAINIVSHATGGDFADITASLNDIGVEISKHHNRNFNMGRNEGMRRKASELRGDLLHSMHEAERKVLVTFHEEIGRPLADVAAHTGLALNDVRTLAKGLVIKGLAYFGTLVNDEGQPAGSGYLLTVAGADLKTRALAADVAASAALAA